MPRAFNWIANSKVNALIIFFAVVSVYWFTAPGFLLGTDGATRDAIAHNIVYDGSVIFFQAERGEIYADVWAHEGPDGHLYSIYGIGQSLLEVPFMFISKIGYQTHTLEYLINVHLFPQLALMTTTGALIAVLAYISVLAFGYRQDTALKTALLFAFSSPLWVLTRQTYDVVQEAVAVLGAVTLIILASKNTNRERWYLIFAGLLWGLALSIRISAIIAGPGLAVLLLTRKSWSTWLARIKAGLWLALGFALLAWIPFAYNYIRFGKILEFGYSGHAPYLGAPFIPTAAHWIAGPWRGMLVYMPILLLIPLAWHYFNRDDGVTIPLSLSVLVVSYIGFYSQYTDLGIMGWGPYYILPAMLPYALILSALFEHKFVLKQWQRILMIILIVLSVLVQLTAISVPMERYLVESGVNGMGFDEDDTIYLYRSPIIHQARGTVQVFSNLPNYRDYIRPSDEEPVQVPEEMPAGTAWENMLNGYFGFNLPDWWWLVRAMRGGVSGYFIPFLTLPGIVWVLVKVFAKSKPENTPSIS